MKKTLLSIALLALMSLTAQASNVEQMEATVSQIMEDAIQTSPETQDRDAVALDTEKNDTQAATESKEPTQDAK